MDEGQVFETQTEQHKSKARNTKSNLQLSTLSFFFLLMSENSKEATSLPSIAHH